MSSSDIMPSRSEVDAYCPSCGQTTITHLPGIMRGRSRAARARSEASHLNTPSHQSEIPLLLRIGPKVEDVDAFFNRGPSNDTGDLDAQPFDDAWPKREAEDIDLGYAPVIGRASAEPQQQALSSDNISDSASTRIRKWRDSASTMSTPPSWSSPSSFTSTGLGPSDSRSFQHVPLNQLLFGAPPFIFTCTLLLSLFLALFINLFLPPR